MKKYKVSWQILNGDYEEVIELNERELERVKANNNYKVKEVKE